MSPSFDPFAKKLVRHRLAARVGRSAALALCTATMLMASLPSQAQGTLRIAMTAADIPLTTGQADQGGEGQRFMANTLYDQLVMWDLSSADKPSILCQNHQPPKTTASAPR